MSISDLVDAIRTKWKVHRKYNLEIKLITFEDYFDIRDFQEYLKQFNWANKGVARADIIRIKEL